MQRHARLLPLLAALVAAVVLAPAPGARAANQNETRLDVTLTPSLFAPVQAVADATHAVRRYRTDFAINVEDLDPAFYDVYVDDVFRGQISVLQVPGGTEGRLRFSSRPAGAELPLNFDPRGKTISIRTGMTDFFSGTLSPIKNPEAPDDDAEFNNVRYRVIGDSDVFPPSRGSLLVKSSRRHAMMLIECSRLPDGPLRLTANGIEVGVFTPYARGIAKLRFSTKPNPKKGYALLDFDPANTRFEIRDGDTVVLEFDTPDEPIGGGAEPVGQTETSFNSTGAEPGAHGSASFSDHGTRFDFRVHVGGVLPGDYDLLIGGVKTTTIRVSHGPDGTSGRVSFSTLRDDPHDLPLLFDPRGQTIRVARDDTIFLSMTFPN